MMRRYPSILIGIIAVYACLGSGAAPSKKPVGQQPLALARTPWPKAMGNARNSSVSAFPGAKGGRIRWSVSQRTSIYTRYYSDQIVVGDGRIYVRRWNSIDGAGFDAFDRQGRRLWGSDEVVATVPTIDSHGNLWAGLGLYRPDTGVVQLSGDTGKRLRYRPGDNQFRAAPNITPGGSVVVSGLDSFIYIEKLETGFWKSWKVKAGHYVWATAAVDSDGTIYVPSMDEHLYVISESKQEAIIRRIPAGRVGGYYYRASPVIGPQGTLYFTDFGPKIGTITAVDRSFKRKWRFVSDRTWEPPSVDQSGTAYARDLSGSLCALDGDGQVKWRLDTKQWGGLTHPTIDSKRRLYVASTDGKNVHCFSQDGAVIWSLQLPDKVRTRPVIGPDESVIVGTDKRVYCIE